MSANLENSAVATELAKVSFHSNPKECTNYHIIALILHASKIMLKILQVRLQQYMNWELSEDQAGFRKGRGTRDWIANISLIVEKAREFQKNTYTKAFDCVDHKNCGRCLKRWELPVSWETCMLV